MQIGVIILPAQPWQQARRAWCHADELGFAHAWTYDHIAWRDLVGKPWYAALPTLAAAAVETTRIGIGTLVATPNLHHPVPLAQAVMTLDDLSMGRMSLGVGAGTVGLDAGVLGGPALNGHTRHERFAEFVELLDRLLGTQETSYRGRHFEARQARIVPGCQVPVAIAATGPRGMALTARYADTWVTNGFSPEPARLPPRISAVTLGEQVARMDDACRAAGRDPATLRRLLVHTDRDAPPLASVERFRDTVERAAALGFTDLVVPYPRADEPYRGEVSVLEQVASELLPEVIQP